MMIGAHTRSKTRTKWKTKSLWGLSGDDDGLVCGVAEKVHTASHLYVDDMSPPPFQVLFLEEEKKPQKNILLLRLLLSCSNGIIISMIGFN